LFFAAVLLDFLVIVPGIAAAESNTYTTVTPSAAKQMLENNEVVVIDVRVEKEFNAAHLNGAVLVPVKNLGATESYFNETVLMAEVKKRGITNDKPILVYCLSGSRSEKASQHLANNSYTVYNMKGGIQEWINAGYSVVSTFVDISDVDDCIKHALNAQINCVFVLLENGYDQEARGKLDKFNLFVDRMKDINRINNDQATYLKAEAEFIRKMIV
jgi:rhodanese-related sulfurtransferase